MEPAREILAGLTAEQFVIPFFTVSASAMVSAGIFLLGRLLSRGDSAQENQRKDLNDITKAVGRLESAKDRAYESDKRQERRIEKLEEELLSLRDRVLLLENQECNSEN